MSFESAVLSNDSFAATYLHPVCNEAREIFVEIVCVAIVFGITTTLLKRAKKPKASKSKSSTRKVAASSCAAMDDEHCDFEQTQTKQRQPTAVVQHASLTWRRQDKSRADDVGSWRADKHSNDYSHAPAKSSARLAQFIHLNELDKNCALMLRRLSPAQAEWVMDQEFAVQVDPTKGSSSCKVVHTAVRARQKTQCFLECYPNSVDIAKRMAQFVQLNNLDERCARTLERLNSASQRQLMDHEFVLKVDSSKGTASAKVIGRILSLKSDAISTS